MTAFWLILLTIITCASIPVLLVILTSPHPSQFIIFVSEKIIETEPYKAELTSLFIPNLMV
ncbi:MAG: hypothetical protein AB7P56_03970 [Nitrososphaeraceae archaeon]